MSKEFAGQISDKRLKETPQSTESWEQETARRIISSQSKVDRPVITRCSIGSHGMPSFAEGSPYLIGENYDIFSKSIRDDISLMEVEPAKKIFRKIDPSEGYPIPESCTPYGDANSMGFYLKNTLPLVFVRTKRGQLLLEARVALKYLRENEQEFKVILTKIKKYARKIFRDEAYRLLCDENSRLVFSDVVQPYGSFTNKHISMRAGLWVNTPEGVSTVIGPPVNQKGPLKIVTGLIDTTWHHFELFVVTETPEFEGRVLFIEPGTIIAQMYFVSRASQQHTEIRFSREQPSADPTYAKMWDNMANKLVQEGKGRLVERDGIASVQIGCPHCFVSVTSAAESNDHPEGHVMRRGFNPAYKIIQKEYDKAKKDEDELRCGGGIVPK